MRPPSPKNGNGSGTRPPDGPKITELRKAKFWTREDFEMESHYAVMQQAAKPNGDRRIRKRAAQATRNGRQAGICVNVLASAEKSNPAFPITLKVIALTLGVPVEYITRDPPT